MAGVAIEDVRKSFARVEVLKGVSTGIEDGELRVVLGPSGCGKSTLLRLVAGPFGARRVRQEALGDRGWLGSQSRTSGKASRGSRS